jgi:hypothetical protein
MQLPNSTGYQLGNFHLYHVIFHEGGARAAADLAIEKDRPFLPTGTTPAKQHDKTVRLWLLR